MTFGNPVVGGTVLIRPAIQSPNYVAGSAGWQIAKDGNAEFNSVSVRGTVTATDATGSTVTISANSIGTGPLAHLAALAMQPAGNTGDPAVIGATANKETLITSPSPVIGGAPVFDYSEILMSSGVITLMASIVQLGSLRVTNNGAISQASGVSINGAVIDANGNLTANNIQKGIANITTVANAWTEVAVTFPTPFATIPVVTVTGNNNAPAVGGTTQLDYAVTGITTTGCLIRVLRATVITMGIGWIAIA